MGWPLPGAHWANGCLHWRVKFVYYIMLCKQTAGCNAKNRSVSTDNTEESMRKVYIFTDGACLGNPGPGGWGAILRYGTAEKEIAGGEVQTTNNRMELTALLRALQSLKEGCQLVVTSDSKYVLDALQKGWAAGWQKRGWKKSDNKPALNADLWEQLLEEIQKHTVEYHWIKGHTGHPENERCDQLAVAQAQLYKNGGSAPNTNN